MEEETFFRPLLAKGLIATEPPTGDVNTHDGVRIICPPMSLMTLSQTTASSGGVIELNGKWGTLTSNKVPVSVTFRPAC